ncbi:unnamed protein product, partial [Mesorhabditis belari]|uniref:Uncharacterized protein n=1 Tax=Mesorhabditis belari TaxID=2138241 RepID=A0AAF3F1A1_9BILA
MTMEEFFTSPPGHPDDNIDVIEFIKTLKKIDRNGDGKSPFGSTGNLSSTHSTRPNSTEKMLQTTATTTAAKTTPPGKLPGKKGIEKRVSASDLLQAARKKFALTKHKDPNFHSLELPEEDGHHAEEPTDLLRMPQINSLKVSERKSGSEPANLSSNT